MTSLYISADHSTRQMTGFPMMGPDGTQYPGYGVTAELLESMGYAPVPERPRPDDRFYLVESSPKDDGSWVAVPKPLEQIKEQLLGQVKGAAGQAVQCMNIRFGLDETVGFLPAASAVVAGDEA